MEPYAIPAIRQHSAERRVWNVDKRPVRARGAIWVEAYLLSPARNRTVALILIGMTLFFGLSKQGGWMFPMMAGARVLLFLATAVGVLLNRFCVQMGGGEIARVIRFIIAYVATRCLMNVVFALNKTWAPVALDFEALLNVIFPWIFLFGVTLRARVAVQAEADLARVMMPDSAH